MKVHPLVLALVLIVLDITVVAAFLLVGYHPGPPVLVLNVVALVVVFALLAMGRIKFRE